jgi:hypothetical protein
MAIAFASMASAQFNYNFDSLANGDIVGQDGWVTVADPTPEAGAVTVQTARVSPLDGSTKALQFTRVLGQAGGVSRRVMKTLPTPITSGFHRVRYDLLMSGRTNPSASNLFLSSLLYSGVGAAAANQIIQPYGQNGGGPGGALNGFTDIDGLDISGYVGYNLVSGFLYPDTWYRLEFDMDFTSHTITNIRTYDISGGTLGLPYQMGTYLPQFGIPKLKWYFNNDGATWADQWNRLAFRGSGMQGAEGSEYLVIDNVAVTNVNKITAHINLGDFIGGNVAQQRVVYEVRNPSTNAILDQGAVSPDADGTVTFYTGQTGTVDIGLKGSHWLRQINHGVSVAGGNAGTFGNVNGDVDGDNEVSIGDYAILSDAYGSDGGDPGLSVPSAGWNYEADLNNDDVVDIGDYAILSSHFGQVGDD